MDKRVRRDISRLLVLIKQANDLLTNPSDFNQKTILQILNRIRWYTLDELSRLDKETYNQFVNEAAQIAREVSTAIAFVLNMKHSDIGAPTPAAKKLHKQLEPLFKEILALGSIQFEQARRRELLEGHLKSYWHQHVETDYLYHGTSSIVQKKIETFGLSPGMRPWEKEDWQRLNMLYLKGRGTYFSKDYDPREEESDESSVEAIHISSSRNYALEYSLKQAPAAWQEMLGDLWNSKRSRDIKQAQILLLQDICRTKYNPTNAGLYRIDPRIKTQLLSLNKEIVTWYYKGRSTLLNNIEAHTILSRAEIKELLTIFNRLWLAFHIADRPILVVIDPEGPSIKKIHQLSNRHASPFTSFEGFSRYISSFSGENFWHYNILEGWLEDVARFCITHQLNKQVSDIKVSHRIPRKDIVRIEEV